MRVALCMIVRGVDEEAPHLQRCLESVKGHVDGIFINVNYKPPEVIGNPGNPSGEVFLAISETLDDKPDGFYSYTVTEWHDNFAEARNANFAQVPEDYDWILWLDADDTIDKPKKIRDVCEASGKYDSVYVDYEYDHDEQGNPLTVHMVARLIQNNGSHKWKGSIHETLVETRSATQGMTKDFTVVHHADAARTQQSYDRNIKMLEAQIKAEQKDPDPRTFYYLASTYMDSGLNEAAIQLFNDYLEMSGWDQERCVAQTKLGRIYLTMDNRTEAKKHFMLAIGEDPDNPDPRVEMGSLELEMTAYRKAQVWLESVLKMDVHQTTLERNPMTYTFRTYLLLTDVYMGMGGKWLEKAAKFAQKARKYKKDDPEIVKYTEMVEQVYQDKLELETLVRRYKKFLDKNQKKKAQKVLDSIPERLADNPVVARLRQHNNPFTWPKRSIVIMTGDTALDSWGPWSLQEGIGGSEEAIIRLAPKLQKLGYKVVVYAKPGEKTGLYDGVMWRNYWEWNPEDEFDVFVAWRAPFIFEKPIKARKKYLWLHDVMEEGEFGHNRLDNLDKVIVLSKYHRSLFPMIPDEKIMLSSNGIDPEEFKGYEKVKRDPHKMIYASSHVRGLAYLYKIWPEVKKAVPKATLDVYYGRGSYDKVHRGNPERMKWMDDMINKAKELDGVTDHGKVSQQKIIEESFKAGVWPYPCPFPEIYPCHGDTLIECLDGKHKLKDLVGKKGFHVYSCDSMGDLSISEVKGVFLTRKNASMIKIGFKPDRGRNANKIKYLTLTPDHEVMLRDGAYCPAGQLNIKDSVKAFHRRKNEWGKGYDTIGLTDREVMPEHHFVAEKFDRPIRKGEDVDHLNEDTHDNRPENLEVKTRSQHWFDTWSRKTDKQRETWNKKKQVTLNKTLAELGPEKVHEMKSNAARGIKTLSNHKVYSIEAVENADAFCMEVEPDHNFVANGIFVHNCITAIKSQAAGAVPVASNFAALDETIQFGHKQEFKEFDEKDLEKYKEALIWWLQHPEEQEKIRPAMQEWARSNSWEKVAKSWNQAFQS